MTKSAIITAFRLVARGRHAFLLAALGLAVVLSVVADRGSRSWVVAFGALTVLTVSLYGLSVVAILLYHPRRLLVRPSLRAFDTPLNPNRTLHAGAFTFLGAGLLVQRAGDQDRSGELWQFGVVASIALAVLTVVIWYLGWRWHGVRLTPDGLIDRQPFGSVFVPWAALAADEPAVSIGRNQIALYFEHPELVVKHGYRPGSSHFLTAGADADLLAGVIAGYVAEPERRAAIGTEAELRSALG
ncbi:membrane protein implicated in regulation of membrane protease activity [Actinoplanes tereljensis]|uniref:PH domain-containing protein n=1 Tax=Paractinoplanes tereljensis TaxID=571912 RepID=A0A919TUZ7_9ACTN|nr:hypothetical protein [Actinoplanes tereljensis]GIF21472.1 hypothetical protein Ate02nite_42020 [Actinoplanes tereljensis]